MNNWVEITTSYGSKKLVNMDTGSSVEEGSDGQASLSFIGGSYGTTITSIKETYQEMKDLLGVTLAQEQKALWKKIAAEHAVAKEDARIKQQQLDGEEDE